MGRLKGERGKLFTTGKKERPEAIFERTFIVRYSLANDGVHSLRE
jgi:hypothetical protein